MVQGAGARRIALDSMETDAFLSRSSLFRVDFTFALLFDNRCGSEGAGLSGFFFRDVAYKFSRVEAVQYPFELDKQFRGSASFHSLSVLSVSLQEIVKFPARESIIKGTFSLCITKRNRNFNLR